MGQPDRNSLKVNALNRLVAEYKAYKEELSLYTAQLQAAELESNEYEVQKLRLIVDETKKLIPSVRKMIEDALLPVRQIEGEGAVDAKSAYGNAMRSIRAE